MLRPRRVRQQTPTGFAIRTVRILSLHTFENKGLIVLDFISFQKLEVFLAKTCLGVMLLLVLYVP